MRNQICVTIVVNLLNILYGISIGWAAPNMLLFQSEASPIGVMTADQNSLIVSLLCIGGTAGTILFGLGSDYLGRKMMLLLSSIPQITANILVIVGTTYSHIYAARFLFGLAGGGAFIIVPIFVSEISHERIRGALCALLAVSLNIGIVVGYILASWMDYRHVPYVCITMTILFVVIFVWIPESPDYLAHMNKVEAAKKSYNFYGNIRQTTDVENTTATSTPEKATVPKISMTDFKDTAVRKAIVISFTLIIFADLCGLFALISYMTELFDWAKIKLDVYVATITVGVIQVFGAVVSSIFVDRFGRRFLLILSCVGTGLCFFSLAFYFHILPDTEYKHWIDQLQWLPLVSIGAGVFIASIGLVTLPFFLIAELTPVKLRGLITSIALAVSWMFAFLVLQYYHAMVDLLGISGTICFYATCCIVEIFIVYFFLPETKNLSFDEIQDKLRKGV